MTTNNAEIFGVVRYDEDGTIDPSFNGGQIAANAFVTSFDNINDFDITSTDQVRAVAIDADGKIVLAGSTFDVPNLDFTPAFALQRYNSDGSLDDGFGTNGSVETILNPDVQVDVAYAVTVDSAGRIIAGGTSAFTSETEIRIDLALVRYLGNGDLDTDFGNDGIVTTSVGNGMIGTVNALAIQTDGKILIGGTRYDAMTTTSLLVGRYETNGSLDADFGIVIGYTFEGFPDSNRTSMAVLTNETMSINEVVLGNWVPGDGNGDFVLSRFNLSGDNTPPTVAPISGPTAGVRAFSQTFSSSFTDPDSGDTWTVTWDFGDPTGQDNVIVNNPSSPGALSASHTYLASGAYTVTLNIDDGVNPPVEAESLTITISDTGIVGDSLQVGGTDGNDTITVSPGSGGATDVSLNGDQTSWSGFTQIVIMAGDGNDTVRVNPNVNQSVAIFGGAGDDSLKGGSGDDILIGGDGDDLLHGQAGRDLLIGGDGQDRIVGQTDSDILVAGLSNYDSDLGALNLVLSEWTSSRSYGQRSANIIGHDITIGAFSGPRNNGSIFLTPDGPSATVFDDADVDVLTGSAGEDLFLFNADNPVQDTITDLSAGEFAADLEFLFTP
ncbi:MAG TPA: PKD domain-containing protein [Tepidisphaeraceae bacterium]|nr:PKD domain-containing protein [Tepidisphaeraceae bacterium]